jgi:hypothetical protein
MARQTTAPALRCMAGQIAFHDNPQAPPGGPAYTGTACLLQKQVG